ncbi:MAG: PGPGW domain-containing protein [archaeon]
MIDTSSNVLPQSQALRKVKKIAVFVIGMTILIIGIAMILLPGPAILVIPLGLAILATEFLWAKEWLHKIKVKTAEIKHRFRKK